MAEKIRIEVDDRGSYVELDKSRDLIRMEVASGSYGFDSAVLDPAKALALHKALGKMLNIESRLLEIVTKTQLIVIESLMTDREGAGYELQGLIQVATLLQPGSEFE